MWDLFHLLVVRVLVSDWYLWVLEIFRKFHVIPRVWGNSLNSANWCYRVHPIPECFSWSGGRGRNHSTCSLFKRHLALLLLFYFPFFSFCLLKRKYRKKRMKVITLSQQLLLCCWANKCGICSFKNIFCVLNIAQVKYLLQIMTLA